MVEDTFFEYNSYFTFFFLFFSLVHVHLCDIHKTRCHLKEALSERLQDFVKNQNRVSEAVFECVVVNGATKDNIFCGYFVKIYRNKIIFTYIVYMKKDVRYR